MAHKRREKVKGCQPISEYAPPGEGDLQHAFCRSLPQKGPKPTLKPVVQASFAVSHRELCDDEKEFIYFPVCEGTSQPEPSCSAVRITDNKNYRSQTSQGAA
ncbi:hypothetical protein MDA_GLEAN10003581 [Myotis davidii]|uniref:Uncharacterized protein n=1 Tax=Myotis davidii TaxID=225400 RepID=L5LZ29_MYODS|nr:hypothetical protein MDA_GLEAN10003581 [Myotis davidii]